ncbi:hypothetical protein Q6269_28715, partial [Klebsiella pneumoniae]|nr:hypothetical protein [Klebsiella pneumoniae]
MMLSNASDPQMRAAMVCLGFLEESGESGIKNQGAVTGNGGLQALHFDRGGHAPFAMALDLRGGTELVEPDHAP